MGTSLNHVGLRVSNGKDLKDRLKAAGVKEDPTDPVTGRPGFWKPGLRGWGNVYSADGLKIEILDNLVEGEAGLTAKIAGVADPTQKKDLPPVASDHNHMYLPTKASVKEAEEWYSKMFGAQSFSDTGDGALLPARGCAWIPPSSGRTVRETPSQRKVMSSTILDLKSTICRIFARRLRRPE
jgi:hypothetical protein